MVRTNQPAYSNGDAQAFETDVERSPANGTSNEPAKDPDVVEFDGPEDPENPMNWSTSKKTVTIVLVSMMTFLSYVRSSPCSTNPPYPNRHLT